MNLDSKTSLPPDRRLAMGIFAHPDDAEILCAGTLIRLHEECGFEVHIATATAGDCGSMDKDRWEITAIRVAEARRSAEMIGATYHCLDERDGFVLLERGLLARTVDLFRQIGPTIVFTHPRLDYMMDHEQVHLLARSASFLAPCPNASTTPTVKGIRIPHMYHCDPLGGTDPYTGNVVRPTTVIDVTRQHDKKLAMLACHASQRDWLRAHHGVDEYLDATRRHDTMRGELIGCQRAEAFVLHRGHAYPNDDVLVDLLGAVSV